MWKIEESKNYVPSRSSCKSDFSVFTSYEFIMFENGFGKENSVDILLQVFSLFTSHGFIMFENGFGKENFVDNIYKHIIALQKNYVQITNPSPYSIR